MIQASRCLGFPAKALQVRIGSPVAKANHLESDSAVETFLSRAINHSLTATTDYLEQFIVTKVGECLWPIGFLFNMRQWQASKPLRVIEPSYRTTGEQIEASLKQASRTKAFRGVSKDFRSALSTNPGCAAHNGRAACALPIMYCAKISHTLRSQHTDQMAQFIFDIAGDDDCVTDFFSQQKLITLAESMKGLPKCIIGHA